MTQCLFAAALKHLARPQDTCLAPSQREREEMPRTSRHTRFRESQSSGRREQHEEPGVLPRGESAGRSARYRSEKKTPHGFDG